MKEARKRYMLSFVLIIAFFLLTAAALIIVNKKDNKNSAGSSRASTPTGGTDCQSDREFIAQLNQAQLLLDGGKWEEGEALLENLLKKPGMPLSLQAKIYRTLGDLHGSLPEGEGDREKAKLMIRKALQLMEQAGDSMSGPEKSETWQLFGMVLITLNEYREAEKAQEKALEIDPSNIRASYHLAHAYQQQGKNHKAKQILEKLTGRLDPDLALTTDFGKVSDILLAYIELAELFILEKNLPEAEKYIYLALNMLQSFEKKNPESVSESTIFIYRFYSRIGWILLQLDELTKAEDCFKRAIETGFYEESDSPYKGMIKLKSLSEKNR